MKIVETERPKPASARQPLPVKAKPKPLKSLVSHSAKAERDQINRSKAEIQRCLDKIKASKIKLNDEALKMQPFSHVFKSA